MLVSPRAGTAPDHFLCCLPLPSRFSFSSSFSEPGLLESCLSASWSGSSLCMRYLQIHRCPQCRQSLSSGLLLQPWPHRGEVLLFSWNFVYLFKGGLSVFCFRLPRPLYCWKWKSVCFSFDCWHSECAFIISCSCYFLAAQAILISDNVNQEENRIHLTETDSPGNWTLWAHSAIQPVAPVATWQIFTEHHRLLRSGRAVSQAWGLGMLIRNSQTSIIDSHYAWIGKAKKLP